MMGSLRLLISTAAPLAVTSVSLLSVRTVAYVIGFGLSSILSIWAPIVLTLIALTGSFGGNTDTSICDAYRAEMQKIAEHNEALSAAWAIQYEQYKPSYDAWVIRNTAYYNTASNGIDSACAEPCDIPKKFEESRGWLCYMCKRDFIARIQAGAPKMPAPPPHPNYISRTHNGCGSEQSSPDCPEGRKVWLQVLWGSPGGNASDTKGCFIIAYSQDSRDLPINIEYNPFLPELFVKNQAANYDLIKGNKFFGIDATLWKDLDSSAGWDKGYWAAEIVHPECRGWRPGWSLKVK
ncbi:MAG TPA: hypothetical protein VGB63_07105 [Pedobacter sp.]